MNRIELAIKNTGEFLHICSINDYSIIPLYVDKDGLEYFYTFWHLEQLIRSINNKL